jgi:hypothetical protein
MTLISSMRFGNGFDLGLKLKAIAFAKSISR